MKRFFTYYFTRLYAVAFCLLASVGLWGQSMANYTFTSNTTSSLEDLSSGATSLLAGNNDDVGTVNTAIDLLSIIWVLLTRILVLTQMDN